MSFASFCIIYLFTSDGEATLNNFMKLGLTHVCGEGGGRVSMEEGKDGGEAKTRNCGPMQLD